MFIGNKRMKIEVVDTDLRFSSINKEWNALLDRSKNKSIFMRWEWMYYWWRYYKDNESNLFIILLKDNGKIKGIAPLYLKKASMLFKKLRMLGTNEACPDHLDFITGEGQEDITIKTMLRYIESIGKWDILDITNLQSNTKILKHVEEVFGKKIVRIDQNFTVCRYIDLKQPWNNILENFNPRLRNTIRRKGNKLKKLQNVVFTGFDENIEFDNIFNKFVMLAIKRHSEKKIVSPYKNKKFHEFHRKVGKEFYDKGMVKIIFLEINFEIIAGIYLFIYNNKILYYQSGFLHEWKKLSPGSLLFYHCIKMGYENQKDEFDFLQGDEEYKMEWSNLQRKNIRITIYNKTFNAAIYYLIKLTKMQIKKLIMKVK